MSMSLRRRIALGTTVTTAVVTMVASTVVWLAADAVMYHTIDATVLARLRTFEQMPPPPNQPPHTVLPEPRFRGGPGPDLDQPPAPEGRPHPGFGPGPEGGPGSRPGAGADPDSARNGEPEHRGPPPPADAPPPSPRGARPAPPEFKEDVATFFLQYCDGTGEIARSPSLPEGISLATIWSNRVGNGLVSSRLPDGRWLRLAHANLDLDRGMMLPPWVHPRMRGQYTAEIGRHVEIYLANDITPVHRELLILGGILAELWLVATVLSAVASLYLRKAILRPIERIAQIIAGIGPDNLKTRVEITQVPQEMHGILDRLNALVGRLDDAFVRERSTIANIAHELRTPVAGLSASLEFALARGPHASRDQDLRDCLEMTLSMQRLIANLLMLARLESGQLQVAAQPVDASEVMRNVVASIRQRAVATGHQLIEAISDEVVVMAGEEQLRMILVNVLDNALSYAVRERPIRICLALRENRALIQVVNGTDGRLREVSQVFTPFWRGDSARSLGSHCGLGLSLVQRQLAVFSGTVEVHLDQTGDFILEMRLPLVAQP